MVARFHCSARGSGFSGEWLLLSRFDPPYITPPTPPPSSNHTYLHITYAVDAAISPTSVTNLLAPDLPENHVALVKANGVMLLCELISDEDDDEISDRAYVCLKKLGMLAIN